MWNTNFDLNERSMRMNVEEARRQAEIRRLQLETGDIHLRRLLDRGWWGLSQLGRLLTSLGQRLEQAGSRSDTDPIYSG
jgi:hypothetical protein